MKKITVTCNINIFIVKCQTTIAYEAIVDTIEIVLNRNDKISLIIANKTYCLYDFSMQRTF